MKLHLYYQIYRNEFRTSSHHFDEIKSSIDIPCGFSEITQIYIPVDPEDYESEQKSGKYFLPHYGVPNYVIDQLVVTFELSENFRSELDNILSKWGEKVCVYELKETRRIGEIQ